MGLTKGGRNRLWVPWSSGDEPLTVGPGAITRLVMTSILEGATILDRKVQIYTHLRSIISMSAGVAATGTVVLACAIGIIPRDLTVTTLDPVGDPTFDWLWHEEFMVSNVTQGLADNINRDIRGMRKAGDIRNELHFYIENRDAAITAFWHASGRTLLLEN